MNERYGRELKLEPWDLAEKKTLGELLSLRDEADLTGLEAER
jgi:hypothetical protein